VQVEASFKPRQLWHQAESTPCSHGVIVTGGGNEALQEAKCSWQGELIGRVTFTPDGRLSAALAEAVARHSAVMVIMQPSLD